MLKYANVQILQALTVQFGLEKKKAKDKTVTCPFKKKWKHPLNQMALDIWLLCHCLFWGIILHLTLINALKDFNQPYLFRAYTWD